MTEHKSPWRVRMEARKIKLMALVDMPFPAIVDDAGGYYCNAKRADAVISRLERELAAEKALADDLYIGSKGTANQITKAWGAYRKARGL